MLIKKDLKTNYYSVKWNNKKHASLAIDEARILHGLILFNTNPHKRANVDGGKTQKCVGHVIVDQKAKINLVIRYLKLINLI